MRWLPLVLLLIGCDRIDAAGAWTGTIETLPNGAVRVTNPAQGLWTDETAWRLIADLAIGEIQGPDESVFGEIIGLQVDGDGRIYVLDRQANELRVFSAEGRHLLTTGREGSGPGEYTAANGLLWIAPDSLLVVDERGARYSILTSDGAFVRSVPRELPFYAFSFTGAYLDGYVYELYYLGRDPADPRPAYLGTSIASRVETSANALDNAGPAPRIPTADTIFLPSNGAAEFNSFTLRDQLGSMSMGIPFTPRTFYHLDSNGTLWHGNGSTFRIFRTDLSGDTITEIRLDATATPVTETEIDEWLAGDFPMRFVERGGKIDRDLIPSSKPFFEDLYVDPSGYLWASVPAPPMEVVFAIFDPVGRYLGRVHATGFERVTYVPPVVRDDRLYLVGRDGLGVQRIHRFRIEDRDSGRH